MCLANAASLSWDHPCSWKKLPCLKCTPVHWIEGMLIFVSFVPILTLLMQLPAYLNFSSDLGFPFSVQTSKTIAWSLQSFLEFLPSNRANIPWHDTV